MKIILLTINYNSAEECICYLKDAVKNKKLNKIVVLDNASKEKDYKILYKGILKINSPVIELQRSPVNVGFSGGFNKLIRQFRDYDIFIISNCDIKTEKNIDKLIEVSKKNPSAVVSPVIYSLEDKTKIHNAGIKYSSKLKIPKGPILNKFYRKNKNQVSEEDLRKKDLIKCSNTGFSLNLIPKKVFKKIGLLDETFFIFKEDNDFFIRLIQNKIPLLLTSKIKIWHPSEGSYSGKKNLFLMYHRIRSSIIFYKKYFRIKGAKVALIDYLTYLLAQIILNVFLLRFKEINVIVKSVNDGFKSKFKNLKL